METYRPSEEFTQMLVDWLTNYNATKASMLPNDDQEHTDLPKPELPAWALQDLEPPPPPTVHVHAFNQQLQLQQLQQEQQEPVPRPHFGTDSPITPESSSRDEATSALSTQMERLTVDPSLYTKVPSAATTEPSAKFKRSQMKLKQPWRRTSSDVPRRSMSRRQPTSSTQEPTNSRKSDMSDTLMTTSGSNNTTSENDEATNTKTTLYLPHDILLAILSHLQPRANAQQYYDQTQPSDLLACSRVNMAWRIAALSSIWQTIVLPDPFDRSCRRLLHLLASSHATAQITGKSYDITEIIQRVEVDLLEATEFNDNAGMINDVTALLQFISPFRTLSIQLPQEIEYKAAEVLAGQTSLPLLEAITKGVANAKIRELDMPSPMYCPVPTFPGMLTLISSLKTLRVLVLGYSSRDWPLLRSIISLPLLESLCVFDSCWSNQIWIYLLSSLGPRLRGLTVIQGRRPLQGVVLREGIAPFCTNLTSLSIPFIPLLSGPGPVLTNDDVIPILKACHELQSITLTGQLLLGDPVLAAMADLWGLQTLDVRKCAMMTGQTIKSVRWQSIQRVRMFGCGDISQEFMDLVLQAWRSGHSFYHYQQQQQSHHHTTTHHHHHRPMASSSGASSSSSAGGLSAATANRFASVLDLNHDNEDPVEMGWVRQREDEPPLDLDEDHFFADWYC
ncbi:hypothetical protein BGZ52_001019 [Haplosporangium bisporale]|uniref:F-box domain-containing protein n=1 Tax=Podila verticillata NRRL 6337 TaxID=1069443 RepID=A0A086TKY2_9FUNG|nr:hypothetical protein BGZ52_001019 [Haplosporangium bisporale]KFH62609.1 hypothetical protein MVEG_12001 [Podila verticillata NRRL 6337]